MTYLEFFCIYTTGVLFFWGLFNIVCFIYVMTYAEDFSGSKPVREDPISNTWKKVCRRIDEHIK